MFLEDWIFVIVSSCEVEKIHVVAGVEGLFIYFDAVSCSLKHFDETPVCFQWIVYQIYFIESTITISFDFCQVVFREVERIEGFTVVVKRFLKVLMWL